MSFSAQVARAIDIMRESGVDKVGLITAEAGSRPISKFGSTFRRRTAGIEGGALLRRGESQKKQDGSFP